MEKEIVAKRSAISLPSCVAIIVTLLVLVCLSMCAVLLWQIGVLKQQLYHQEVTIRKLQASNSTAKQHDLESLKDKITQLTAKQVSPQSQTIGLKSSESIHLVGDETKFPLQVFDHIVKSWAVVQKQGDLDYIDKEGAIVIAVPGIYYIYSQMHYFNEKDDITGHFTYINARKVLESIVGISSGSHSKHFTNQHGGLFQVNRFDRIQVRLPYTHKSYKFTTTSSYFGLFRIGP